MRRWSGDDLERMAGMHRAGDTHAVMAAAFGVSRGVIAGLVSRNPDLFPKRPKKPKMDERAKAAKRLVARRKAQKAKALSQPDLIPVEAYDTQHLQLPGTKPVSFVECSSFQCRMILTPGAARLGPDTPCCGQPVVEGMAYCAQHLRLIYRKDQRKQAT